MRNKMIIGKKKLPLRCIFGDNSSLYLLNFASVLLFVSLLLVFFLFFSLSYHFFKLLSIIFSSDHSR